MTIYFDPESKGFYDTNIHAVIPETAIEISEEKRKALLEGQAYTGEICYQGGEISNQGPTAEQIKKTKIRELNEACRQSIIAGFSSFALGNEHFYKYTLEDQANLQAALSLAKESGGGQLLKCSDESGLSDYREHSLVQLQQVFVDAEAHKMGCLKEVYKLKSK